MIPALLEAYCGYHEDEIRAKHHADYVSYLAVTGDKPTKSFEQWVEPRIRSMILADAPQMRLHVYLTWHGIIGYTHTIFTIATGEV